MVDSLHPGPVCIYSSITSIVTVTTLHTLGIFILSIWSTVVKPLADPEEHRIELGNTV